jgi:hypothetical protein
MAKQFHCNNPCESNTLTVRSLPRICSLIFCGRKRCGNRVSNLVNPALLSKKLWTASARRLTQRSKIDDLVTPHATQDKLTSATNRSPKWPTDEASISHPHLAHAFGQAQLPRQLPNPLWN